MAGHLSYGLQSPVAVIGSTTSPVTLTTAYTGNTAQIITSGVAMITFYIQYTAQTSGNSIQIQIQGSPDTVNSASVPVFYSDLTTSATLGSVTVYPDEYTYTSTGTSATGLRILFPAADQTIKVSIKETVASGSAGTASVRALEGSND